MVRIPRWFGPSTDEARAYAVQLKAAKQELHDAHAALWAMQRERDALRTELAGFREVADTPVYDGAAA